MDAASCLVPPASVLPRVQGERWCNNVYNMLISKKAFCEMNNLCRMLSTEEMGCSCAQKTATLDIGKNKGSQIDHDVALALEVKMSRDPRLSGSLSFCWIVIIRLWQGHQTNIPSKDIQSSLTMHSTPEKAICRAASTSNPPKSIDHSCMISLDL